LLTFLLVFIFWELIRLPRSRSAVFTFICVGLALTAAIFTHEFALNFVPVIVIIFIMEWRRLRQWIVPAAATCLSAWAVYLVALFWVLPPLVERVVGRLPPMDWMTGGLEPIFADPLILLPRVRDFVFVGAREMINQNMGAGCNLPVPLRLLGPAAAVVVLAAGGMKSLRAAFKPLLPAALYFIAVALFMFPVIPATIEMPVYYYATIVLLFVLPLGALLSNFRPAKDQWRWAIAAGALLLIGVLNFAQSSMVLRQMPADFGFNATARAYTRDVLSLPPARRAEKVFSVPVYTAYPRPRVFDISRRWDIMLRVWHGEAEQVFSMMMPVVNLRLYENGRLIGDPDEFLALAPEKPDAYEARAGLYWDMPARRLYHLGKIRAAAVKLDEPLRDWINLETAPSSARELRGRITTGLLGDQPRVSLPPGKWSLPIPPPSAGPFDSLTMFFSLRADLMPPGPDDVMERITPLPLRVCRVMVRKTNGEELFAQEQSFGWSWQLFQSKLPLSPNQDWEIIIESDTEVEVLGPVFVMPEAKDSPWSREYTGAESFAKGRNGGNQ